MPDTLSTYKRKYSDAQIASGIRTPSTTAMKYQTSATYQYIESLDKFANAGMKLADTYFTAIANRDARDADTQATKLFRERRIQILQNVKGKDADGLLDREKEWAQQEFEKWKKDSKVSAVKATEIWRNHMDSYLDKTGAYMVEQQAAYDKQSRLQAADTTLDGLVDTKVGDIKALDNAMTKIKELFPNDPMLAEKTIDKAIMTAVSAWTRQSPAATISWFKKNKEDLKKRFGQKYVNVSDAVDRAEAKMEREIAHANVLAERADRIRRRQREEYSDKKFGEFMTLITRDRTDIGEVQAATYALTDDPNIKPEDKLKAFHVLQGLEKASIQAEDASKKGDFEREYYRLHADLAAGNATMADITASASKGLITPEQHSKLVHLVDTTQEARVSGGTSKAIQNACAQIKARYVGAGGLFDVTNPANNELAADFVADVWRESKNWSATEFEKNLSLEVPGSWINNWIATHPKHSTNLQDAFLQGDTSGTLGVYSVPSHTLTGNTSAKSSTESMPPNPIEQDLIRRGIARKGQGK